jgi:uncharacterized membrane protein YkoI
MVLVAAVAGAGLGIGGMSLLGASNDAVALQAASLPSQEARPEVAVDGAASGGEAGTADVGSASGSTVATTGPQPSSGLAERDGGVVDRSTAERAALAYVGEGRVTWVSQEDDYGAVWEIEVTLPNGREVDVYVDAAGQVVHTSSSVSAAAGGERAPAPPAAPTARQDAPPPAASGPPAPPAASTAPAPRSEAAPSAPRGEAAPSTPSAAPQRNGTDDSGAGGVVDRATAERAALAYLGEGRVTWVSREDDHGAAWEIEVTLPNGREVDVYVDAAGRVVNTS